MKENSERNEERGELIIAFILTVVILVGFMAPPFIGEVIWRNNIIESKQQELESYSPNVYEYLIQSVRQIFNEEQKIIDINAKPDDIIIEKIEVQDNDKIICKLRLDNGEDREYFSLPTIIAEVSSDFDIVSVSSDYSSKEQFTQAFIDNIKKESNNVRIKILMIETLGICLIAIAILLPTMCKNIKERYKRIFQEKE